MSAGHRSRRGTVRVVLALLVTAVVVVVGMQLRPAVTADEQPAPAASSGLVAVVPSTVDAPDVNAVDPSRVVGRPATRATLVPAVAASATPTDIPPVALAAYQRAAVILEKADEACRVDWTLLAAVGYVESDHGRVGASRLRRTGVARPAIRGIALDGRNGTARIDDTDAGKLDRDPRFDRAVGPMQFLPSTWSVVGVDSDGDGVRNPHDIDDAALAAGVYLCSGGEDLSTAAGQRQALFRYNRSAAYVDKVLAVARRYALEQDGAISAGLITRVPGGVPVPGVVPDELSDNDEPSPTAGGHRSAASSARSARAPAEPSPSATTSSPTQTPSSPTDTPTPSATETPSPSPTDTPTPSATETPSPTSTSATTPTSTPSSTAATDQESATATPTD